MMRSFLFACSILASSCLSGQADVPVRVIPDTLLQEVVVEAFNSRLQWKAVPAAVAVVTAKEMNRYANVSLVPILNTVPGIRMEERSPASYRLSVRGSLLRSPFGVRNVKVYWNGIPLTDGGGNTYLNLLEPDQLTGAEIIKGPAASVYGAGTGGALLLRSDLAHTAGPSDHFQLGVIGGSYGLFKEQASWQYTTKVFSSSFQQSHLQADGYREQSAMRRDAVKWQGAWQGDHQQLKTLFFYTDLFYQTPGGITLAQMQANPALARQPAGILPGAVQQKAAIYNRSLFGGIHHEAALGNALDLKTFLTGSTTDFTNPFITNYEKRSEQNLGAGTNLVYHTKTAQGSFQWMNGMEWLHNQSTIDDYGNRSGVKDTVQFKDKAFANQWFAFSQMQYTIGEKWNFTAGLSINSQSYKYRRLSDPGSVYVTRTTHSILTPRFAVLYRISREVSLYALAAKGFSPPALAEVRPSDGNFYGDLGAESGWNYEAGIKGELFAQRLQFDVAAYFFKLENAIVRRNNQVGAEYFVNAGGTEQKGIEGLLKYRLVKKSSHFIRQADLWTSMAYQPYRFTDYQQGIVRYSGNELTGVPRTVWVSGADMEMAYGIYMNASLNAVSALPLSDANDAFAKGYQLVQLKAGFRCGNTTKCSWNFFTGIDNLLDQQYSLGNDINAAGRRYYNPAARRNLFAGVDLRF
ncbi:MAG: TonB-dependent receptor YncD precursor [Sediminibacterium sp.]|nr:TonB-dependent receptor YncD precursor [Sediminibacterium sp.]